MKTPAIPANEVERLASLRSLGLVDTPPEERFDAITRLLGELFQVPIAYISLVDENRQFLKSRIGLDFCETSRDISFCGHAILENEPLIIPDTFLDERFADNPQVVGEPFTRFYAGMPLQGPGGHNIGTLCLMDRTPRTLSEVEIQRLAQFGKIVERELRLGDVIRMQDELLQTKNALIESQRIVNQQMDEALAYVTSLLPPEMSEKVRASYQFIPSSTLGGDSFGFHWIEEGLLAVYLLDVCGHGVGSALLSVSAMNVLKTQTLPDTDFREPARVLSALNRTFTMEKNGGMFFTIWYGVLDVPSGKIRFSAAGHPPAVIVRNGQPPLPLGSPGLPIGTFEDATFETREAFIPQDAHLYVFSDGIYEIRKPDDTMGTYEQFLETLKNAPSTEEVIQIVREKQASTNFDDDVSVIRIDRTDLTA
jgi:sigma-B regulation protein RsbU (phosphoserine phosphatase)